MVLKLNLIVLLSFLLLFQKLNKKQQKACLIKQNSYNICITIYFWKVLSIVILLDSEQSTSLDRTEGQTH